MTDEQNKFADTYHMKKLRFTPKAGVLELAAGDYICTAALYKWEPNEATLFAILGQGGPPNWISIQMMPDELETKLALFEVLPDDEDVEKYKQSMLEAQQLLKQRMEKEKK